jgi:DnaJ-class molecular chaperone
MASFEEIDEARKFLGLGEFATLKEIKQAYRKMSFRYHPDTSSEKPEHQESMKKLNRAYKLLTEYCARYKYTFNQADVDRAYPEERIHRRFADGWFDSI